jgi:hypothetical protein
VSLHLTLRPYTLVTPASRFVLDTYSHFESSELAMLSSQTQLKLERKRSWFYERFVSCLATQ